MKSLVLILGAGSSEEVGLPVGRDLKSQIAELLDIRFHHGGQQQSGDHLIKQSLRLSAPPVQNGPVDINPYLQMCGRIRDAMPQAISIDHFIDSQAGEEKIALCGKLAIARAILSAESKSSLRIEHQNSRNKLDFSNNLKTWFHSFFQLLTENCRLDDLPSRLKSIGIVTFNYDRCLEHYLYHALQNYYSISKSDAAAVMSNLAIHHPYGMVGTLPWMGKEGGIDFGAEPDSRELISISKQIRTFTEGTDPKVSDIDAIRLMIAAARRLTFFGFAFHRMNMNLIFDTAMTTNNTNGIFATALGFSSSDCEHISKELSTYTGLNIHGPIQVRNDLSCSSLVKEYWRSLSLN